MRLPITAALFMAAAAAPAVAQEAAQAVVEASTDPQPQLRDSSCLIPVHPEILNQAGIEGRAIVAFVIDSSGNVDSSSVRVVSSSHRLFERPARTAIMSCQFQPGRVAGRAVRVRMQRPINFLLSRTPAR